MKPRYLRINQENCWKNKKRENIIWKNLELR